MIDEVAMSSKRHPGEGKDAVQTAVETLDTLVTSLSGQVRDVVKKLEGSESVSSEALNDL